MNTTEHIVTLIHKQLSGQASEAEQRELAQWKAISAENHQTYESFRTVWEDSALIFDRSTYDKAAAWQKIDPRRVVVVPVPVSGGRVVRTLRWGWMAAAAVTLIVAVAAWFTMMEHGRDMEYITASKKDMRVKLPDGSIAFLRKGATLAYAKDFNQAHRQLQLDGEGFFEVEFEASKPFTIITEHAIIRDLGTSFWVNAERTRDEMAVISGKVSFAKKLRETDKLILTAGQKASLEADNFSQSAVVDSNFISWKTGILDFNHTPLSQVLTTLQVHYQIGISISPELAAEIDSFNIVLHINKGQSWEEVKDELQLMTGYTIEKSDSLYVVKKRK
ncbi:FecR domain-containing protein [Chitinophaga pendula]|uniref:FecR family protein n=1 Tax=Chitinophaga TaxID=79328 RepID=UPI000BAF3150|nr:MULTISPECIES: FecR domain-containing protein [Chitinophaga]ASZ12757.1 hypothetical protein CK934_18245 [Chitinophaga sp. MD30]UCJ09623.1 FecR domain-containing protein [Chitinophaga pendula]